MRVRKRANIDRHYDILWGGIQQSSRAGGGDGMQGVCACVEVHVEGVPSKTLIPGEDRF